MAERNVVAAFDFDETLTNCDTLLPFLCFTVGPFKTYLFLLRILPKLVGYLFNIYSRQEIKEALLAGLLIHLPYQEIEKYGERFANEIVPNLLNKKTVERLRWHQQRGDRCILISAAMEFYLKPWGKKENFDEVIASRCQVNSQGYITGRLEGENCWGAEKVRRLEEVLGPKENYLLYAYGDSKGDAELLAIADDPFYRYGEKSGGNE